ncbi:MAG: hypothetical protein GEU78_08070 [Actinobacteria bacterium]|nr:hypothetical protein [Actinomycetota bacterium]
MAARQDVFNLTEDEERALLGEPEQDDAVRGYLARQARESKVMYWGLAVCAAMPVVAFVNEAFAGGMLVAGLIGHFLWVGASSRKN